MVNSNYNLSLYICVCCSAQMCALQNLSCCCTVTILLLIQRFSSMEKQENLTQRLEEALSKTTHGLLNIQQ